MIRIAMTIGLKPEMADAYLRLHADPFPGVLAALRAANVRNYSIYRAGEMLFGYLEYYGDDYTADMERVAADPETRRWWSFTDPCQTPLPGTPPGEWWTIMEEVFHLD